MEPAVLERIFEPFFTTKDVGQGSGLGLSQLYGFIKQSDGHVTVESTPGGGTVFRLYFPYSSELPQTEFPPDAPDTASRGRERILVVEDNEDVREVVVELIRDLGYSVLVARNGREALSLLRSDVPIDLLFTDIVMPNGIDGVALADAARALGKRLKIVLTSGYAAGLDADARSIDVPLILKPYRREDLARLLRDTLDS
jgi:CheY-like chemotaxis protein